MEAEGCGSNSNPNSCNFESFTLICGTVDFLDEIALSSSSKAAVFLRYHPSSAPKSHVIVIIVLGAHFAWSIFRPNNVYQAKSWLQRYFFYQKEIPLFV